MNSDHKIKSGTRYKFNNVLAVVVTVGTNEIEWREYCHSNKIRTTPRWYFEKYAQQT